MQLGFDAEREWHQGVHAGTALVDPVNAGMLTRVTRACEVEDLPRPVAVRPRTESTACLGLRRRPAQLGSPHAVITSTLCGPHSGTRRVGESKLLRTSWLPMSPAPRKLRKALRTIGTHVTECIDVARLPPTQLVESRQVSTGPATKGYRNRDSNADDGELIPCRSTMNDVTTKLAQGDEVLFALSLRCYRSRWMGR